MGMEGRTLNVETGDLSSQPASMHGELSTLGHGLLASAGPLPSLQRGLAVNQVVSK